MDALGADPGIHEFQDLTGSNTHSNKGHNGLRLSRVPAALNLLWRLHAHVRVLPTYANEACIICLEVRLAPLAIVVTLD